MGRILVAVLWSIWLEENNRLFQDKLAKLAVVEEVATEIQQRVISLMLVSSDTSLQVFILYRWRCWVECYDYVLMEFWCVLFLIYYLPFQKEKGNYFGKVDSRI